MTPQTATTANPLSLQASKKANAAVRAAFQDEYHSAIMAVLPSILTQYVQDLQTTDDPEIRRKGLAYFSQVVGVEAEKKQDATTNRPVVTINIGRAAAPMTITAETAGVIQSFQSHAPSASAPTDESELLSLDSMLAEGVGPSALMRSHLYINDDITDVA